MLNGSVEARCSSPVDDNEQATRPRMPCAVFKIRPRTCVNPASHVPSEVCTGSDEAVIALRLFPAECTLKI